MKKVYLSILSVTIVGLVACGETKQNVEAAMDSTATVVTETTTAVMDSASTVVDTATAHVEAAVEAHAAH